MNMIMTQVTQASFTENHVGDVIITNINIVLVVMTQLNYVIP